MATVKYEWYWREEKTASNALTREIPDVKSFSVTNLQYIKCFMNFTPKLRIYPKLG